MPQIQATGVFNSAPELLKNIAGLQPDVLILDRQLPKGERKVLELIVKEYTNQEMAETLFLSLSAIEFRRNSMMQKLGVKYRRTGAGSGQTGLV